MITIKNLTKRYAHVYALDKLSINIKKGQLIGIIGPNGSGKTTLLDILSGIVSFDSGKINLGVTCTANPSPHKNTAHKLTRTFQKTRLFEQMTVMDNLLAVFSKRAVFPSIFQKYSKEELSTVNDILKTTHLHAKKNMLAGELSYGQKKLLEISRAVIMEAEIYLFDEPFAGLFPEMIPVVSNILRKLSKENKTVILIEHDMKIIQDLTDHIFVLDNGKLLAEGDPRTTLLQNNVIDAYLGN
ncbi:MAG: ATP-binding cassette domain-containing protein [Leadbetterella sp.]|nr:ATP-binding cassette domain-containing protein [Leadbetterella sp.]